jgi:anthranilate synthase/aminodeoxychorismate synthase-like glutamine amidotransferase
MILMIDNYDSFTYNLVQYIEEIGKPVDVVRNDMIDIAAMEAIKPEAIVISPGPGGPDDAGVSLAAIAHFSGKLPCWECALATRPLPRLSVLPLSALNS